MLGEEVSVMCVGVRVLCVWEFLGAKKHRAGERILVSSIPVGRWRKCLGRFKMQAHRRSGVVMDIAAFKVSHSADMDTTALQAARARSSSVGAMDASSGKVQDESTHHN